MKRDTFDAVRTVIVVVAIVTAMAGASASIQAAPGEVSAWHIIHTTFAGANSPATADEAYSLLSERLQHMITRKEYLEFASAVFSHYQVVEGSGSAYPHGADRLMLKFKVRVIGPDAVQPGLFLPITWYLIREHGQWRNAKISGGGPPDWWEPDLSPEQRRVVAAGEQYSAAAARADNEALWAMAPWVVRVQRHSLGEKRVTFGLLPRRVVEVCVPKMNGSTATAWLVAFCYRTRDPEKEILMTPQLGFTLEAGGWRVANQKIIDAAVSRAAKTVRDFMRSLMMEPARALELLTPAARAVATPERLSKLLPSMEELVQPLEAVGEPTVVSPGPDKLLLRWVFGVLDVEERPNAPTVVVTCGLVYEGEGWLLADVPKIELGPWPQPGGGAAGER